MRNHNLHRLIPQAAWLWLFFIFSPLSSVAQTTNINGVVNSYYQIIQVIPAKACVRVTSTAGLAPSNKVLLVQMKGASINTANAPGYGDTTALNEAGNYEVNTICAIRGDSLFLVYNLLNTYTTTGKFQLVRFGEYVNANVTGALSATTWNNATGTGGVIAIFVEQDLTLNANIRTDASGFAGGAPILSSSTCGNSDNLYFYNGGGTFPYQRGAYKGEGISDFPAAQSGGRGAAANGGGGGNDHNNGGGGGSNLTFGGIGGGNSGTSACFAAFQGEGGKVLSSWGGKKIFLGGGGGAGHKNFSGSFSNGANGGGIIFIHAANVIGNGNEISSSGGYGGNSQSDGAGGGGGGGTIIMDVSSYTGAVTIKAEGGHGGDSEDGVNNKLCFGGGGGGSGGVIYFSGAVPAIATSIVGGGAGVETNRAGNCNPVPVPAAAGIDGQIITSYAFKTSGSLAVYCSGILPVRLTFFKADPSQKKVTLQWQLPNPEAVYTFTVERMDKNYQWITLATITANDLQQDYFTEDNDPLPGYNSYRLKINEKNNSSFYSVVRRIFVGDEKEIFTIYPNPATDKIIIKGSFMGTADIQLFDISGKVILQQKNTANNSTEINLPNIPPGIYVLHINNTISKLAIR